MLSVENITVGYGDLIALRDVSISIKEGELVSIVGSNGAGKTTLMRTISGLMKPSAGSMTFRGRRIDGLPTHEICRMGIIQVPEGRKLFPKMKVIGNLEMGAYLPEARRHMNDSLQRVFTLFPVLKERQNQPAGTLSGGEQQMLALGRSIMSLPKLLLIDEPSIGLAPKIVGEIFAVFKELSAQGVTILLVSQEVQLALELSTRAYVIENGRLVLSGPSADLLRDDRVRAAYLGL